MRSVLLPQAITSMLPVLVSQLVVALKDTAIGYQITFLEMVRQGTVIGSTYGNYVPALIVIAVLMISLNFALSAAATRLEKRLRRSKRTPSHSRPIRSWSLETDPAGPHTWPRVRGRSAAPCSYPAGAHVRRRAHR